MSKRRTRKQKQKAKHQFSVSWHPNSHKSEFEAKKRSLVPVVKRQTKSKINPKKQKSSKRKRAYYTEDIENLGTIKRAIVKSLILASLILALEVVLYLA